MSTFNTGTQMTQLCCSYNNLYDPGKHLIDVENQLTPHEIQQCDKIQYQYDSILLMVSRIFLKLYLLITEKPMKGTNTN